MIICAYCSEFLKNNINNEKCLKCQQNPFLKEKYKLFKILGQGSFGLTYLAENTKDNLNVAIKELPFRTIDHLKIKELFTREAKILKEMNHKGVPLYYEDFLAGQGKSTSLYLVHEFIDGETLANEFDKKRYTEY